MARSSQQTSSLLLFGLSAAATVGLLYFIARRQHQLAAEQRHGSSEDKKSDDDTVASTVVADSVRAPPPPTSPAPRPGAASSAEDKTPVVKNTKSEEKVLHARIEELDKKGKVLFKDKQYLEAALAFTEALSLMEDHTELDSLRRQEITLMNNRSAMYEKANMPELALEDCNSILEKDVSHTKARTRKLRILEALKRYDAALQEVCAIQLLFMKANRNNMRMGLPVPPPPVPQSKMEELLGEILPSEVERYTARLQTQTRRPLPSYYTITQLLRSYTSYNAWMARAARDGSVAKLSAMLVPATDTASKAERAAVLLRRGRRYAYDKEYDKASEDFEVAMELVGDDEMAQDLMPDDSYARLLEWAGMVRHWHYELDAAMKCYQKCADLEPMNADILVKQAGVQMDAGKQEEAMKLFDMALGLDATTVDALLHRSNLQMLQGKVEEAKKDLERCLELRPNHVMARLRLASILAAMNDGDGAKQQLDLAEQVEPNSSEVQSYRGELFFTQGQMDEARQQFEKAIALEPSNPTPYVNAAMALLNTPTAPGQPPDAQAVMDLLEKAIDVDPQFTAAYMQLGQLALGTATDLSAAREVITLYDRGLENCRSPEEIKELCSMRILAVSQVDAATMLGMETFNMQ